MCSVLWAWRGVGCQLWVCSNGAEVDKDGGLGAGCGGRNVNERGVNERRNEQGHANTKAKICEPELH